MKGNIWHFASTKIGPNWARNHCVMSGMSGSLSDRPGRQGDWSGSVLVTDIETFVNTANTAITAFTANIADKANTAITANAVKTVQKNQYSKKNMILMDQMGWSYDSLDCLLFEGISGQNNAQD